MKYETTLNDVLGYIKDSETWGQNYTDIIVSALKTRRRTDALKAKANITVGSKVVVNGRTECFLGTVTKIMRTRVRVKNSNNGLEYGVPMNLITVKEVA
tara:strand:- start:4149 stop:4445 length:297 start_codon:yes stop_codon:yes gene_type:complete